MKHPATIRPEQTTIEHCYAALGMGAFSVAAEGFAAMLTTQPGEPRALQGLGQALGGLGLHADSLRVHQVALNLAPRSAAAQVGVGVALMRGGALGEAVDAFRAAISLAPAQPDGYANLALALLKLARPAEALAAADAAIAASAGGSSAWRAKLETSRANCLKELGRWQAARQSYDSALALDPDLAEAHVNRGTLHLAEGRLTEGWADYEWRWQAPDYGPRTWRPSSPPWQGSDLAGRTLLLTAEQGLGDTLQFIRYVPLLQARGTRILLCCQPALVTLLSRAAGVSGVLALPDGGGGIADLPAHDFHAPLMSLPHLCATTASTIPAGGRYLTAPAKPRRTCAPTLARRSARQDHGSGSSGRETLLTPTIATDRFRCTS